MTAIHSQTAARDHTMQVGVMEQIGTPGMEHGEKADFSTQVLGISRDRA